MNCCAVCLFLAGTALWSAESRLPITLLLDFESDHSSSSLSALDAELHSIVASSQLPIRVQLLTGPLKGDVAGDLVVFKMKGSCTMNKLLPVGALSDERGPLAMTYMANGEVLHFANVDCDRVRQSVARTVGRGNPNAHQAEYGIALARVMAHELYHMLAKSTVHDDRGITKRGLTSRELSEGRLEFSPRARAALQ